MEFCYGRGSRNEETHLAAHTWPTLDSVLLVINEEPIVSRLLDELAVLDASSQQGF